MAITAGTRVQVAGGRTGVAVYDNAAQTNDLLPSVIVIFNDSTYDEFPRSSTVLTQLTGGFVPGTGV